MNNDLDAADDRSPLAKAVDKATDIFTACLMMVLPGIGGYYADQYCHTVAIFTVLGLLFGLGGGTWQILKIVKPQNPEPNEAP
ncbi:MAG: hypothetical protein VX438_15715 [Planctomycetota bacterium]|jgi:F0F1-type ATP synthase assembly protein I|nr:hypothetical protein [Planctomycetota bacterium]